MTPGAPAGSAGRGRSPTLARLGECGLIDRLASLLARRAIRPAVGEVVLGIGDDATLLDLPPGLELVATIDASIEDVHFRRAWARPEEVGWKALAVNVSDLGAMGARPLAALVTLALPEGTSVAWVDRLYEGLAACAEAYGCPVVGGDTVRSPDRIALSVAALGGVPVGKAVRRSGARPGDLVCVTGVLGDGAAGLALLERGVEPGRRYASLADWQRRPRPPVEAGARLAEAGLATAMIDLSDGLSIDLRHIARASGVGARIEEEALPISDAARRLAAELGADATRWALYGGEDYQLLFTVPPERFPDVPPLLGPLGVTATILGRIAPRRLLLVRTDGRVVPLRPEGFAHFGESAEGS